MLFALLLADALAPPVLLSAPEWKPGAGISPDDYPASDLRSEESAAALITMRISETGKVDGCVSEQTFGDVGLAGRICAVAMLKRVKGAVLRDGQPAVGVMRQLVRMYIPDTKVGDEISRLRQQPDVEVSVNRLPAKVSGVLDIKVSLQVSEDGVPVACLPRPGQDAYSAYLGIACDQAMKLAPGVVEGEDGMPVKAYVIQQTVRFLTPAP